MRYTERGREALEGYLGRVRRGLTGRHDLDAEDVVAGIREHVETELTLKAVDVATAEEVADVLAQVGPAESLGDPEGEAGETAAGEIARAHAVAVLALAALGIALLPTRFMPVGLALLAIGALGARGILPVDREAGTVEARLVRGLWHLAVAVVLVVLLVGPALLVWGSAQIGGLIEEPLTRYADVVGRERPLRYWIGMGLVAAAVSGAWWILLGLVVRGFTAEIRRVLGTARHLVPVRLAAVLMTGGATLILVSLLGAWIA